jgi:hypothetical protein
MAVSQAFEQACEALESASSLNRLEARGTMRLALKEAGLDVKAVTPTELEVVIARVLPMQLERHGIADLPSVCNALRSAIDPGARPASLKDRPDAVFQRMGKIGLS